MIELGVKKAFTDWSVAFIPNAPHVSMDYRIRQMTVSPSEVFTGKLHHARTFYASIESGSLTPLRKGKSGSFEDVQAFLALLGTHNHIARSGDVTLVDPGYWVRLPHARDHAIQGYRSVPVLPVSQALALSGHSVHEISCILRLLFKDGAIRALRNLDGVDGIALNDGFVCHERVRNSLRY